MQKIIPHLWFNTEAKEAAEFYVSVFGEGSKITHSSVIRNTPSGDCDIVSFDIRGYSFMGISAGPAFDINPSISFMLNFDPSTDNNARANLDAIWEKLSDGGTPLMPLDTYDFSEHYGWIQDKYGVSWQLILTNPKGEERPFLIPSLMFTRDIAGKADEAIDLYASVFNNSKRGMTARYPAGTGKDEGTIMFADFMLENQWFAAMDSSGPHEFNFNEAVSLLINCDTQEEIDAYSNALSAVPEAEQCGWLKDKFGLSWQVSSSEMDKMLKDADQEKVDRVTQAFLPMKRLDLATLKKAYEGS